MPMRRSVQESDRSGPGGRRTVRAPAPPRSLVVVALMALPAIAVGAPPAADLQEPTFRATRGVFVPGGARAGDADATAVELNPAQLGFLSGGAAALVGNLWRADAAMPGRGGALFLAAPLWGAGGLGLGLQGIGARTGGLTTHGKFQLAYDVGGRRFSVGATWGHLFGAGVGGTDTLDLGASWRPFSRAALAFVAEDVTRPRLPDATVALSRRWVGELVLRPAATDRLELAVAATHVGGDAWSRLGYRFRLAARVASAWRLFGDFDLSPGASGGSDWRGTAGVAMDFDHATLMLAGRRTFMGNGDAPDRWGASAVWHTRTERSANPIAVSSVVRVVIDDKLDSEREFLRLALRLQGLAADRTVAAVLLRIESLDLGVGRVEELRDLIAAIRAKGKPTIAYLTQATTRQLYLASACDRIVIHPAGEVTFSGLSRAVTFYKGAMDRLGVSVELVRIAEYKGAMEPYVMTGQSEPVRQNRDALLDDVYVRMMNEIASGRTAALSDARAGVPAARRVAAGPQPPIALDPARLQQLLAIGSFTPAQAYAAGLLDAIADDVQIEELLRHWLGRSSIAIREPDTAAVRPARWVRPRVAVLFVDGNITDGASRRLPFDLGGVVGSDSLVDALDEIRRDSAVRAVVVRVNSSGGSAFASDVIARAVARVRAAGKPVVASMGDVAASGGYYIAAPADVIFAHPSTTTGSIGIFGFKLDVSRLLAALSLNVEVTKRGPHADAQSAYRPWTPEERANAERKIRHLYGLFIATVVEGRKTRGLSTPERVDAVGRGAVWTGAQARGHGLVDELGGLTAAIDRAAALGGVPRLTGEPVDLLLLPRPTTSLLGTLSGISGAQDQDTAKLAPPLRDTLKFAAPYIYGPGEGIEARLPYELELR